MLSLSCTLQSQLRAALERAFPEVSTVASNSAILLDPRLVPASKPEFGDFQANCALSLAKSLKQTPRQIAAVIVKQLCEDPVFTNLCLEPHIAGPGFINLTIKPEQLASEIATRLRDKRLGVSMAEDPMSVIVDFSSPNIAKEMHVGHLRSTIIGDSLARVLEFCGHRVLRLNHVGDWGTQFGMLITHLKQMAPAALSTPNALDLGDLAAFYRQVRQRFDEDERFRTISRREVVRLQRGDPLSLKAWSLLCEQSRREFNAIYKRLDIRLHERGESFYNPYLDSVVADLGAAGLLVTDNGARCVFLEGIGSKTGKPLAVIVQKSDGGFNYAATDLAALRYRLNKSPNGDGAQRIIYVTDVGQADHFTSVFQIAQRAGWVPKGTRLEHVPFGLVQGEDGKKLKTRSGSTVRLRDLLDEAVKRAEMDLRRRLQKEGRKEEERFIQHVATAVGLAAVKYADLSQNRTTNYQFSFDRMLALQGNTAPYLLYAIVRIAGIARKGGNFDISSSKNTLHFSKPQEWALVRELLKFDSIIAEVEEELLPSRLCNYLFELSQVFSRFYDQVSVLGADSSRDRTSRLALCQLTADTLKLGLNLLGIPTLERM